jgi:hypothetical protein
MIEFCSDRACQSPLFAVDVEGTTYTPPADLPAGGIFFRLRSRVGRAVGDRASAPWHFVVPPRSAPQSTTFGSMLDWNGDGRADAIISSQAVRRREVCTESHIFLGTETGLSSTRSVVFPLEFESCNRMPATTVAGDVNGDGFTDIAEVFSDNFTQKLRIRYGGNAGTRELDIARGFEIFVAPAGDFDGDGYGDLVVTTLRNTTLKVAVHRGSRDGISLVPSYELATGSFAPSVAVGDFDGNGRPDIALSTQRSEIAVFLNDGAWPAAPARVEATHTLRLPAGGRADGRATLRAIGDANGDGRIDLLVTDADTNRLGRYHLFYGSDLGLTPAASFSHDNPNDWEFASEFAAGDFNGDGFTDFVVGSQYERRAIVFVSAGASGHRTTPSFVLTHPTGASTYGSTLAAGDFTGTGITDLLVGASGFPRIYIHAGSVTGPTLAPTATIDRANGSLEFGNIVIGSRGL